VSGINTLIELKKTHTIRVFYLPMNAQVTVLKTILKFTLK